jgi:tRNA (cmo5U34)-methyltransferase
MYYGFKRRSGYSETEIARKREALENVLVPYRPSENRQLLRRAGFDVVDEVFRWYNFILYVACKRKPSRPAVPGPRQNHSPMPT